jgi:hypothetical protein
MRRPDGRRSETPHFEAISRSPEELIEVSQELIKEGKKTKNEELQAFGTWLKDEEGPRVQAKKDAKERARSRQLILELMPRKKSTRITDKEEQRKQEDKERERRKREELARREADEKARKDREREQRLRAKEQEEARQRREEERQRMALEAEREKRLKKRRRLMAKQAAEFEEVHEGEESDGSSSSKPKVRHKAPRTVPITPPQPLRKSARISGGGGGGSAGQSQMSFDVGTAVEVLYDGDWWNAKIVKRRESLEGQVDFVIAYEGGSGEDDEWVPEDCGRIRAPTGEWDSGSGYAAADLTSADDSHSVGGSVGGSEFSDRQAAVRLPRMLLVLCVCV